MNEILNQLQPQAIWKNFRSLTLIPRPSKSEDKIREFMVSFGKGLGLETIMDEVGNVIIRKPATKGMENRKGIVMQGHLDMVPQANSDKKHDFTTDPIEVKIDGEWVKANGTTLGADNGIGVAAAMAILESKDIPHGPIEALFTADEETGMTGAFGLKPGILHSDILLNMDSEDEGELYVGCAGGIDANITFDYDEEAVPGNLGAFTLKVSGLKGGHSGMDIILGRGNANKLLFRFLKHAADEHRLRIAYINGGGLRNAIPREAIAVVTVPVDQTEKLTKCVTQFDAIYKAELSATEPNLSFTIEKAPMPAALMDKATQWSVTNAIYGCPNGVIRMSDSMPGLVETSNNLASVATIAGKVKISCLLRSSVDSAKDDLAAMLSSVFELAGADVQLDGGYPGWKPNMDSPILKKMQDIYQKLYGKIPEIKAIHAGLECGLLGGVYPNWDMISFGPTIRSPHSPDERVNIETVQKFWDFLVATLKDVPVK
ncbi:MAG TPA: cytosol nonspecific dipeptidase [Bacteroidales bacterium]|nr:MAG: cytosol nonspecific dipeptidase [Bacteroidetes bacterium GWE2_42_24]OFY27524.1 MAG: cytosol nonspecific dipeptidase [Bacteroidetes bacterium GWF2_43_11]HAQ64996.1 cytosol nonspecific dipeptidase [Bacteroidales bacterium]HBZ66047.1 cytosol nonspecific dipeptidase [Bacteroidales bacterium]